MGSGTSSAIVYTAFLYESAPFPSCHAATLVETRDRKIVAAFFGGTHERHPDVCIWVCHLDGEKWTEPVQVADGVQLDGSRQPTWNPVLFQPRVGPLMLFYKVGPNPRQWWGMLKTSHDGGHTWGPPMRLPDGLLGPIKNKPVQLPDGLIVSPSSVERFADPNDDGLRAAGATESNVTTRGPESGWHVYFELSSDNGESWQATPWVAQPSDVKAIQPSVLVHSPTRLQAIGRTKSKRMFEVWSDDGGRTWGELSLMDLPNCNSGTDAVTLQDGTHVLVYNHSETEKVRYPLNVATSRDGKQWRAAAVLETDPPGQYSYPAVIQDSDGMVHVAYTWKRLRMKHVVLDPHKFGTAPIVGGAWPG
jgi:predicted neuraminidase